LLWLTNNAARTLASFKNLLCSFLKASFFEYEIGLMRGKMPLKFRSLKMSDQGFPPLDDGAVASGEFF